MSKPGNMLIGLAVTAMLGCATPNEELLPLDESLATTKESLATTKKANTRRSGPITGSHIKRRSSYPLRVIDRDSVEGAQGATAQDIVTGRD